MSYFTLEPLQNWCCQQYIFLPSPCHKKWSWSYFTTLHNSFAFSFFSLGTHDAPFLSKDPNFLHTSNKKMASLDVSSCHFFELFYKHFSLRPVASSHVFYKKSFSPFPTEELQPPGWAVSVFPYKRSCVKTLISSQDLSRHLIFYDTLKTIQYNVIWIIISTFFLKIFCDFECQWFFFHSITKRRISARHSFWG